MCVTSKKRPHPKTVEARYVGNDTHYANKIAIDNALHLPTCHYAWFMVVSHLCGFDLHIMPCTQQAVTVAPRIDILEVESQSRVQSRTIDTTLSACRPPQRKCFSNICRAVVW